MSPLKTPFRLLLATIIALFSLHVQAQEYRSKASGNWTSPGIWEVNDGSGWVNASEFPIAGNSTLVDVRSPHTVTVSGATGGDFSIDDLIIRFGATLTMADGCHSFADGPAEKDVQIFGTYNAGSPCGSAGGGWQVVVSVESGGIVNFNTAASIFTTFIVQENGTVNGNTAINAAGPVVNNGTWNMAASHAITIPAAVSFTNNGLLVWKAGTVTGSLVNNGIVTWTGGTVTSVTGSIQNNSGAQFTLSGGTSQNGSFTNTGTVTWSGGTLLSHTAIGTFLNNAGAVFNMTGVTGNNTFYQAITNHGTINFSGTGTLTPNAGTSITNSGSINLNAGQWDWNFPTTHTGVINIASGATLNLSAGVCSLNAGTALLGTGTLRCAGATVNQNLPWTNSSLTFNMIGGTWNTTAGNPMVVASGSTFNWQSGTIGGASGLILEPGMVMPFSTTGTKTLNSALTNNGTINWSGGVINGSGSITNASGAEFNISFAGVNQLQRPFTNQAGATINYTNAGVFNTWTGTTFTNAGTLNVVNGVWQFIGTVSNSGTLHIPSGRFIQFDATASLNAGTTITGGGTIVMQTGTVTQNIPWTNSTHTFNMNGGTWTNSAGTPTVFIEGSAFNWTGGTLAGAQGYSIASGLTATFSTTGTKTLNSALTNNGTINWSGGVINGSGSITNASGAEFNISFAGVNQLQRPFTNQAGAAINYTNAGVFNTWTGTTFTNAGTLNVVNGVWQFIGTVSNSGTLHIPSGRFIQFDATASLNAGTAFTGGGTIVMQTGTVTQNFPWTNSSHTFNMNGGTWNNTAGNPTVFGSGSTFNWQAGTLGGLAPYTINSGVTASFTTTGTKLLHRPLVNHGIINYSGGTMQANASSITNNAGAEFNILFSGANVMHPPFDNYGVVNYSGAGTFSTHTVQPFSNHAGGVLNVNSGEWQFNPPSYHYSNSVLNIATGASLRFNTAATLQGTVNNSGTLAGTITSFTGPTFTNNGSVTLTSLPLAGTTTQTLNGTGTISNLTINNANGVTLGGDQTVTGTLAINNGKVTLGSSNLTLGLAASITNQTAARYIVTDGTGSLRRAINGANVLFPVGTTSSYLPATLSLTSGPQETFAVRVQDGVHSDYSTPGVPDGALVQNDQVERTWVISEQTEGGNQATVQLQWNAADEGTDFDRSNSGLHSYNGTDWVALALGTAGGGNPYTLSATTVGLFREFTVADAESSLPLVCNNGLVPGSACDDLNACTMNDAITAGCVCAGTFQDTDNDGICDAEDGCPNDANKIEPGECGCGVADVAVTYYEDVDGDGFGDANGAQQAGFSCNVPLGFVANDTDLCPTDVTKQTPGACGCGTPDVPQNYYADTDGDGFGAGAPIPGFTCTVPPGTVSNNTDACPNDPLKQAPGTCGCGNAEVDTDGDSTPDCIDACPNDPLKIAPLQCGCGNAETDSDNDGTADCVDGCPNDPLKTTAGQCGCGNADIDSDSDGIADCVDNCPGVAGTIGSPCDDGDATTGNDALNAACECFGQLIDCSGVPGGSALPGTACTTSGLPGIWSNSCVCELEGPDVAVQNVSAPNDTIAADQTITLSWEVLNLGNAEATVNWTERYYMESGTGQNRVQLGQAAHNSGTALAPSAMLSRSVQLVMPALINVGDEARFVVEIIPGTGLIELPNSATNNTGTQAQPWVVRKLIKLLVPQTSINEGDPAGIPVVVVRTGSLDAAQVVNISIDQEERFDFPPTLTILAGQSARSFTLVALDNAMLEGPIPTVLTASASGFSSATRNLTIIDNESPALSITGLPATTGEGTSVTFQVNTTFAPTAALQVFLTSSNQARFAVPASVTIQANTTTANVTVNLPQDQLPELDIDVTITAGAANHSPTTATFALTDDDVPGLALVLQTDTVSESAGAFAVQATLQRTAGSSPIAFTAQLIASMPNTLLLPASISLPANANQQTFTIGVVDNALVDGFRNVIINAAVQIAGCGCGAPPATAGNVNATLVVADNDGPSLSVSVNLATMAEGLANAGTLRVQRNTSTSEALSVTLFSSDVNELTLPASVIIPIGASFLDVPITTVNDGTPDGSKQVYVQASAGGFSPGITWCIVTDVNQPDLIVTALSASSSPWAALTTITWQATVANTGFANSIVGVPVRGVLSQNNSVDANDIILFDYTINTPIVAGSNVQISGAALVPNTPGTHKLLIQVNPTASVSELTFTNNTSAPLTVNIAPSYTALAQVAGTTFLRGTTIPVTGTATRPDASPAANEPIEVYVLTNGLRREVLTTTDASGAFTASFVPLANESGHYTVGASFPGMQQTTGQDAFDIHGVRINNGQYPQFVTLIGDTLTGTLTIENLSNAPLTNLTLTPSNTPTGSNFSFSTIPTLAGGASATVTYEVSGTALSPGFNFQAGTLHTVSDQGTIQPQDFFYYCQAPGGLINASLSSINTTVSQAMGQQLVEFKVRNIGAGSTGALSLSLPQAPWLSAMTPVNMPALAPGDSALVILRFLAHASVPFDFPVNGTVVLNGANSNSLVIPFSFMKVSVTTGTLTVDAVNQFTFFDPAEPHVAGASVEVRHAYSNALLASGTTDVNGLFTATNIPEGTHRLIVSKAQHLPYDQPVTINPGATLNRTTFLNYQAITFSWNVVPTAIQDQYDVTLNMVFETNVPMPVVTVDVPDSMPFLSGDEVFAFNATLTNHGLITARDVQLLFPDNDPVYEFITNYVPADLAALQSIQVPVLMRVRQTPLMSGQQADDIAAGISGFLGIAGPDVELRDAQGLPCKEFAGTMYWYYCSLSNGLWTKGGKLYNYVNRSCPDGPTQGGPPTVYVGNDGNACPWCPDPPPPGVILGEFNGLPVTTGKKSCAECILKLAKAMAECTGLAEFGSFISALNAGHCAANATSVSAALDCIAKPLGKNLLEGFGYKLKWVGLPPGFFCVKALIEAAHTCAQTSFDDGPAGLTRTALRDGASLYETLDTELTIAADGMFAMQELAEYYYDNLPYHESWDDFFVLIEPYITDTASIPTSMEAQILSVMAGSDLPADSIQLFFNRWNTTLEANALGVFVATAEYPSILDTVVISGYRSQIAEAVQYALDHGYSSLAEMMQAKLSQIEQLVSTESNAVCASVTVQLSQTVTMTREAFRGTLDIFNGHPTDALDSLTVNIVIKDTDGVPSNGFFQINTEQLTNLSDVTGTGLIPAQEHGIVEFLFIPEIGAAPTVPVAYAFGGEVTYWDPFNEEMTSIVLAPVTLTVNPSPNLMLHYFIERNILGDDALTSPEVEPSIPAELAVMVENDGYGPAVNMSISSAQPVITENESGLAINFSLIGSNLQGQPAQLGVLNIPFGTLPPQSTRIGQWWFTSSLLGKFVSYEASVVHANSFGNPELSLIQGVELHELTRSIREYGPGSDGMNDFLVNDQFDINDRPDIIYFSQGNRTEEVLPAASGSFNAPVTAPTFTNTLTLEAAEAGWNYIKLNDPGNGDFDIVSVTRQDAQSIPLANAWLTFVTLPVSQPPVYEDKFHFVDKLATTAATTYTVVWAPKNTDVPAIDTISGAPQTVTALQVTNLTVVFDKAIDPATFTVDDLTLTFQGGPNLMNGSAIITQLDAFTFNVDLSALTVGNGQYVFTAQAAGVTDIFGISGATGRQVSWTQYISVPAIVAFQGLPGGATDDAFTTIDLLFNLPIDPASFTPEDISITLGGVPQPGTLAIEQINATLFRVSGLENAITSDGAHLFTVDMTGVLSAESEPGIQAQSTTLTRDNTGPVVAELTPLLSGGLDAQHRTGVRIRFSEPVVGLNTSAVSFTRDGQPLVLNIAQLSQIDADEWQVTGFGLESYPDGDYLFAVSATGITDAIGNGGTGSLSTTWNVDRSAPITVTGVNITPDLGISNSDGITSTLGFDALFNLSAAASQLTISQTSFGSEQVLLTLQNLASGPHVVPLSFPTGGNTGLKVTAIGANGGSASGTKSLFIDQAPLSASWQTANNQSLTSDLVTASLQFSAAVLDPGAIQGALSLWKNGQPASTASLTVTPVNSTTYSVGNLPMAASGTGTYELRIDASALNKATSGIAGNSSAALNWTVVPGYTATLRARVFLEGPYAAGAMHDSLRSLIDFPLTEPFTALGYAHVTGGGETISPQVLASPGNDAIVDWVLVELRDANDNTSVVASRCALVQRDGDVVATDGLSPVTLGIGAGAYHVAIRHRNHLGTMTADTARFYSGVTQVDFTLLSTQLYGTEGQKQMGARRALWAGDVNFNSSVQYVGEDNDRDPILVSIGGSTPTSTANGYLPTDVNLDGRVKYVGERNDRDPILVNVGGSTPTNIREAQLPQP